MIELIFYAWIIYSVMTQMNSSSSSGKKRKRKHSSEKEPEYGEVALEQLPMNALRLVIYPPPN